MGSAIDETARAFFVVVSQGNDDNEKEDCAGAARKGFQWWGGAGWLGSPTGAEVDGANKREYGRSRRTRCAVEVQCYSLVRPRTCTVRIWSFET